MNPPVELVEHPLLQRKEVQLAVHRLDLLHPQVSGNKWYKLKYNLQEAVAGGYQSMLSFGGAYSNHLHALAYAGKEAGLKTVGVVRGELPNPLNPSLQDMEKWGMQLVPVSRSDYRKRQQPDFIAQMMRNFGHCYLVPEGGANSFALKGCAELGQAIQQQAPDFDILAVPCGTGATLAGLACGFAGSSVRLLGFSALKGMTDLEHNIAELAQQEGYQGARNWEIVNHYHCGGFAKLTPELVRFLDHWREFSTIPLEPVYTGKMLYGLLQMVEQGRFRPGSRIMALHTGGLQGLRGMAIKMERIRKKWGNDR